jgi:hypothetical protein
VNGGLQLANAVQLLTTCYARKLHYYYDTDVSGTVYELFSQDEPIESRQQQRGNNVALSHRPNSTSTAVTTSSTGSALSRSDAAALRCLLFGDARKSFAASWTQQGLVFNKSNTSSSTNISKTKKHSNSSSSALAYGLVQHDGGPCGPIAVVQALFLDYLLYSGESTAVTNGCCSDRCSDDWMLPTRAQQQSGLIAVLTAVLWRAGSGSKCTLCLCRCVTSYSSPLLFHMHALHSVNKCIVISM